MSGTASTDRRTLSPIARGVALSTLLFVILALFEWAMGHPEGLQESLVRDARPRTTAILIVLAGFIRGAGAHATVAFRRELADLVPNLTCTAQQRDAMFKRFRTEGTTGSKVAIAIGILLGLLIIRRDSLTPVIFTNMSIDHHLFIGLAVNAVLFGLMGRSVYTSINSNRL